MLCNKENTVPLSSCCHRYTTHSPAFNLHKQLRMLLASSWVTAAIVNGQTLGDTLYVNLFIFQLISKLEDLISLSCTYISLHLQTLLPYSLSHKTATTTHTTELAIPSKCFSWRMTPVYFLITPYFFYIYKI